MDPSNAVLGAHLKAITVPNSQHVLQPALQTSAIFDDFSPTHLYPHPEYISAQFPPQLILHRRLQFLARRHTNPASPSPPRLNLSPNLLQRLINIPP